jgi:hypothetical protein
MGRVQERQREAREYERRQLETLRGLLVRLQASPAFQRFLEEEHAARATPREVLPTSITALVTPRAIVRVILVILSSLTLCAGGTLVARRLFRTFLCLLSLSVSHLCCVQVCADVQKASVSEEPTPPAMSPRAGPSEERDEKSEEKSDEVRTCAYSHLFLHCVSDVLQVQPIDSPRPVQKKVPSQILHSLSLARLFLFRLTRISQRATNQSLWRRKAEVLYDFTARNDRELTLKVPYWTRRLLLRCIPTATQAGEIVELISCRSMDDWWTGVLHGVQGIFPKNYVRLLPLNIPVCASQSFRRSHPLTCSALRSSGPRSRS